MKGVGPQRVRPCVPTRIHSAGAAQPVLEVEGGSDSFRVQCGPHGRRRIHVGEHGSDRLADSSAEVGAGL